MRGRQYAMLARPALPVQMPRLHPHRAHWAQSRCRAPVKRAWLARTAQIRAARPLRAQLAHLFQPREQHPARHVRLGTLAQTRPLNLYLVLVERLLVRGPPHVQRARRARVLAAVPQLVRLVAPAKDVQVGLQHLPRCVQPAPTADQVQQSVRLAAPVPTALKLLVPVHCVHREVSVPVRMPRPRRAQPAIGRAVAPSYLAPVALPDLAAKTVSRLKHAAPVRTRPHLPRFARRALRAITAPRLALCRSRVPMAHLAPMGVSYACLAQLDRSAMQGARQLALRVAFRLLAQASANRVHQEVSASHQNWRPCAAQPAPIRAPTRQSARPVQLGARALLLAHHPSPVVPVLTV